MTNNKKDELAFDLSDKYLSSNFKLFYFEESFFKLFINTVKAKIFILLK